VRKKMRRKSKSPPSTSTGIMRSEAENEEDYFNGDNEK
jgi:hypothetical protein